MQRVIKKEKTENKTSIRYFEGLNFRILAAVTVANILFQLSEISSSIFLYAGTAVLIVTLFLIDKEDYIYLFISLLSVLRYSTVFSVSVINIITIIYFVQTYVLDNGYKREREKMRLPKSVVYPGVIFIIYTLQYIFDGSLGFRKCMIIIKLLLFLVYMIDVFRAIGDRKTGLKKFSNMQIYYIAGVLIAIVISMIINPAFSLEATRMTLSEESSTNALGISLAFCLCFVTLGMTKVTNLKEWGVLAGVALPLLYFCFATQSRTCIIAMIIIFASVLILGYAQENARLWITLMAIGSVAVLGGMILFAEGTQIHENIMATIDRFVNPRKDDISGGRFDLWEIYIGKVMNDMRLFFFGGNLSDYGTSQAHNMFIEIFAGYGVFGSGIVIWLYAAVFYEIRKAVVRLGTGKIRLLSFLPLALVFITGMASHSIMNTAPTVNFCLGAAMIYFYGESDDLDEDTLVNSNDKHNKSFTKRKKYENLRRLDRRYGKKYRSI